MQPGNGNIMKIYVVEGSCGEYSDHNEWPVHAYTDESIAQTKVKELTEWANEIQLKYDESWDWYEYVSSLSEEEKNKLSDPDFRWDYSGFNYYYYQVELD
jgi:hypothetical protein